MKTINHVWQDFRNHTISPAATPEQTAPMRHAFYAGATALLGLLLEHAEADDNLIETLSQEICAYAETGAFED